MYKVTITKIEEQTKTDSDWHKIADSGNEKDDGPVYGYVDHKVSESVSTEVYTQKVDDLDLPEVVKAVNGMTE